MTCKINIENNEVSFEVLSRKNYGNVSAIGIKKDYTKDIDILDLKTAYELDLVDITECNPSSVGEVMVKNSSINPLLLVDGEEILGANQNRIVDGSILIAANSTKKISVKCVEKKRWNYESEFRPSENIANVATRSAKAICNFNIIV